MSAAEPSATGGNGRNPDGTFGAGNRFAKGNPYARRVAELRDAMLSAVSPEDLRAIVARLVEEAKAGSIPAAKEVLDRLLGRPVEADLIERMAAIEEALGPASIQGQP